MSLYNKKVTRISNWIFIQILFLIIFMNIIIQDWEAIIFCRASKYFSFNKIMTSKLIINYFIENFINSFCLKFKTFFIFEIFPAFFYQILLWFLLKGRKIIFFFILILGLLHLLFFHFFFFGLKIIFCVAFIRIIDNFLILRL